ncbi:MAG: ferredoxin family protein [Desulfobacterales bacterium]|nr:ferredoxin family protein [Desulfobacterales bacterium]
MPPVINQDLCISCGQCVDICSEDVFFGSEEGRIPVITHPKECWHCNACVLDCPVQGAVTLRIPLPMLMVYK